jgi:hypothetical protein
MLSFEVFTAGCLRIPFLGRSERSSFLIGFFETSETVYSISCAISQKYEILKLGNF